MKLLSVALLSAAVSAYANPILYITKARFEMSPLLENPMIAGYIEDEGARKEFSFTIERKEEPVTEPMRQRWVRLQSKNTYIPPVIHVDC